MKLTNNFSKSEFDCKSGEDMPNDVLENVKQLAVQLQAIRDYVGKPIRINSAYRSKAHNKAIGGVKTSQHILGKAADITIDTFTPDEVVSIIENMLTNEMLGSFYIGGLGSYSTFTHVDIRDKKARWAY
jgi:uncharacterized protein YcbK (DUF882 family)|tara:strand:+ start:351 stop:737 length:387 start_codon:yes stop_codon:yes gene_type:complete